MNTILLFLSLHFTTSFANEITLQPCRAELVSKAVTDSLEHIKGFQEVRGYLDQKQSEGSTFCYEGLTLDKNVYQYYKNLIVINVIQQKQITQKLFLLFQVASIQAHHGTQKRPWIILDSQSALNALEQNWSLELDNTSSLDVLALPEGYSDLIKTSLGTKKETSSLLLGSSNGLYYFLVSWLKDVNAGASTFAGQVSPQYGLIAYNPQTQQMDLIKQGSAYDLILKKLDAQLKENQKKFNDESLESVEQLTEMK